MTQKPKLIPGILILLFLIASLLLYQHTHGYYIHQLQATPIFSPTDCTANLRFAVIGDYGTNTQTAADVARLVTNWQPDFIVTTGDNNYPNGAAQTIDTNIGQYYHQFIGNYQGQYGSGADENRFFPIPGNHDWQTGSLQPYLDYFTLPGNERYYDIRRGPVHIFALDSDYREPDGNKANSPQAQWLQNRLQASTAPWKLVFIHHPPYSSGQHGDTRRVQWPYAEWGATAVLSGHDHTYERIQRDNILYYVIGISGRAIYPFQHTTKGSLIRYNGDYGAMLITASDTCINFSFYIRTGQLIDSYTLYVPATPTRHEKLPVTNQSLSLQGYLCETDIFCHNTSTTFYCFC
ncbi:MAG: alkaline phosphatase [Chloroflexi bacterium]|nr:MAG: alkaline phosphatase [Chloroflexota bacterium]